MEVVRNVNLAAKGYDMEAVRMVAAYMSLSQDQVLKMDPATVADTARVFSAGADTNSGQCVGGTK